jgi:trehalose 6-phosphate phosphatase
VCIVSGRPLQALRRLLAPLPQLRLVGCHGGEGLHAGGTGDGLPPELARARAALDAAARRFEGAWIEEKTTGFALHYRACPEAGETLLREAAATIAATPGLRMIAGSAVVEVLPEQVSKGRVLEHLAQQPPFQGRRPVAVGDDVTDEDSFDAAARLGGFGVLVGDRTPSLARYRLDTVAATVRWLQGLERTGAAA